MHCVIFSHKIFFFENGKIKNCYDYGTFKKVHTKILKSIENRNCKQLWYDMEKHKKVCRGIEVKFMYIIYNTK